MKIHEYQGKEILKRFAVPVPQGEVAFSPDDARAAAERLGGGTVVVKAQIHAGGRGKGGGVKVVKNPGEAHAIAGRILGMQLVTHQTGPEGRTVSRVLIEQGLDIARELYLGLVIDRSTERPVLMVSPDGGVEIEKVAEETPERIFKALIDPALGLQPYQARELAFSLGLKGDQVAKAVKLMMARLPGVRRDGRVNGRDQPAHRDRERRSARARRQAELRRQRLVSPRRPQGDTGISARRIRSRSKRRSSRSTTSSSTARSAAW